MRKLKINKKITTTTNNKKKTVQEVDFLSGTSDFITLILKL